MYRAPQPQGPVNVRPQQAADQMPEIRKYKKRFNSEINCASLWGVNLLIGTNNGLLLLDRSGQGAVLSVKLVTFQNSWSRKTCLEITDFETGFQLKIKTGYWTGFLESRI